MTADALLRRYHALQRAAREMELHRDAVIELVEFDLRGAPLRQRWREVESEMRQLRHRASAAWAVYARAVMGWADPFDDADPESGSQARTMS